MKAYLLITIISLILLGDTIYYIRKRVLGIQYFVFNALLCVLAVVLKVFLQEAGTEDGVEGALGIYTVIFNRYIRSKVGSTRDTNRTISIYMGVGFSIIALVIGGCFTWYL